MFGLEDMVDEVEMRDELDGPGDFEAISV